MEIAKVKAQMARKAWVESRISTLEKQGVRVSNP
jgi:hypothetical protein